MDKLEKDIRLLKSLNKKVSSDSELSTEDQDLLMDLVGEFKDKTKEEISAHFKDQLNRDEQKVFLNFYDNVKNIDTILTKLQNSKKATNEEVRNYFFKGKSVSKLLFTDSFRSVLDYIQTNLNIKVKAEVYADLKIYFETGCYEEDIKNDPIFLEEITRNKDNGEQMFEIITKKNQERNIGVKVENNKETGRRRVSIKANYLNKFGIAKSGYVDCVKVTPKGLVISLATSDGSISYDAEKNQLVDHLSAIYYSIINGEFKYYSKKGSEIILNEVKSIESIHEVRFNLLTSARSESSNKNLILLESMNIEKEKFRFLSECMSQVIDTPTISDSLKRKISLEGLACVGIDNSGIANLESFNKNELQGLIDKKEDILSALSTNNEDIKKHFESVGKYLISTLAIEITDKVAYCELIIKFITTFTEVLSSTQKTQLKFLYDITKFPEINSEAKEDIAKKHLEEKEKQSTLANNVKNETNDINEELKKINPYMTENTIKSAILNLVNTKLNNEMNRELKRKKKEKVPQIKNEHRLYIANNPTFKLYLELASNFKNDGISALKQRKESLSNNISELLTRIINKEKINIKKIKNIKP